MSQPAVLNTKIGLKRLFGSVFDHLESYFIVEALKNISDILLEKAIFP